MKYLILFFAVAVGAVLHAQQTSQVESYIVVERHSGRVLLAAHSELKRPVASLTKVATAKVALDWAQASKTNLAIQMEVPASVRSLGGANPLNLQPGDKITIRDAIYSSMLGSDNAAALTLADFVGRNLMIRRGSGGDPVLVFVSEMNNLAKSLGMASTRFASPHGLDVDPRAGFSTASDMARLSMKVMKDDAFRFYVKQKSREISVTRVNGESLAVNVINTNKLLGGSLKVTGLKTGMTSFAGQCIALCSDRDDFVAKKADGSATITPVESVAVILGSPNREARGKQLLTQGWQLYDSWRAQGYVSSADRKEFLFLPQGK